MQAHQPQVRQDQDQAIGTLNQVIECETFVNKAPVPVQDGNQHLKSVLNFKRASQQPTQIQQAVEASGTAKTTTALQMVAISVAKAHLQVTVPGIRTTNVHAIERALDQFKNSNSTNQQPAMQAH